MSEKSEDGTEVFPMDIAQKDVALLGRGVQLRNFGFFYANYFLDLCRAQIREQMPGPDIS